MKTLLLLAAMAWAADSKNNWPNPLSLEDYDGSLCPDPTPPCAENKIAAPIEWFPLAKKNCHESKWCTDQRLFNAEKCLTDDAFCIPFKCLDEICDVLYIGIKDGTAVYKIVRGRDANWN